MIIQRFTVCFNMTCHYDGWTQTDSRVHRGRHFSTDFNDIFWHSGMHLLDQKQLQNYCFILPEISNGADWGPFLNSNTDIGPYINSNAAIIINKMLTVFKCNIILGRGHVPDHISHKCCDKVDLWIWLQKHFNQHLTKFKVLEFQDTKVPLF